MRAGQSGDTLSYARLLTEVSPLICRTVQMRRSEAEGVECLVQVILLSIHSLRQTYEPARPFKPWLMAIIQYGVAGAERRKVRPDGVTEVENVVPV